MPLNSLDRFVLCGGDKASAAASEVMAEVDERITGTNAQFRTQLDTAPSAGDATGTPGEWAVDATHLFICVDTDTWVRVALAAWT